MKFLFLPYKPNYITLFSKLCAKISIHTGVSKIAEINHIDHET